MSILLPCRSQTNTALICYTISLTTGLLLLFFVSHLGPEVKVKPYRDFDFGRGVACVAAGRVTKSPVRTIPTVLFVCDAGYRGASSSTFFWFVCFTRYHGYIRCQAIVIRKIRKEIVKQS